MRWPTDYYRNVANPLARIRNAQIPEGGRFAAAGAAVSVANPLARIRNAQIPEGGRFAAAGAAV